jgi:hypothetical protein
MSRERSAAFKRLIRKYEFLLEDWEDVSEISKSANLEMMREINLRKPADITENDFTVEESEEDEKEKEEETPEDRVLKKLFRKIVFKSHPDRLGDEVSELERVRLISLYDQAVSAHDDKNWALMVVTAIKLDVELPEEAEEMVDKIEDEAKELEEKINSTTSGIAWQFYHAAEEEKEKIVENYLKILKREKEKYFNKPKSNLILGIGHPRTGTGYTSKLLQSWGLDVRHEKMGDHGTVDWSLSYKDHSIWQNIKFDDYNWEHIIYSVRNPKETINSLIFTEDVEGKPSFKKRSEMTRISGRYPRLVNAIISIVETDKIIRESFPEMFTYRIEDQEELLFNYLKSRNIKVIWNSDIIGIPQNTRDHEYCDIVKEFPNATRWKYLKDEINDYCIRYGYPILFDIS